MEFKRGDTVQALMFKKWSDDTEENYIKGFIRLISNQRKNVVWVSFKNKGRVFHCAFTSMVTTRIVLIEKIKNIKEPLWIANQKEVHYG